MRGILDRGGGKVTHGHSRAGAVTVEYSTWNSMMARCFNSEVQHFDRYGGRGITVCARWASSFEAFLEDMGPRPSPEHSLDRYPNNDGNYEPGNCRWATKKEQSRNMRTNRIVNFQGRDMTLAEAVEIAGLPRNVVSARLNSHGWSVQDALTKPVEGRRPRKWA